VALLEPTDTLRQLEADGDYTSRLALQEELKGMPWQAVWDYFCYQKEVPAGVAFLNDIKAYERDELSKRK
jgi:L-rhamnose isomerase